MPNNTYFSHEIDEILDLVGDLLKRQFKEFEQGLSAGQSGADLLKIQINSTQYGTYIVSNLINNTRQWTDLPQVLVAMKSDNITNFVVERILI